MKKLLLLFTILTLLSFTSSQNLRDGKYINSDNDDDYIYSLEIKNDFKEISFYLYGDKSKIKDYKIVCTGLINKKNYSYFIEDIKCNNLPVTNNDKTNLFIKGTLIQFKSNDLLKNFFHEYSIYANRMKFEKEK